MNRKIAKVVNHVSMEDEDHQDVLFWWSKPFAERLAEVTRLRRLYSTWLNGSFPEKIEKVVTIRKTNDWTKLYWFCGVFKYPSCRISGCRCSALANNILYSISGGEFDDASKGRIIGKEGDTVISFINITDFIANKLATGRPKDIGDVNTLKNPPKK